VSLIKTSLLFADPRCFGYETILVHWGNDVKGQRRVKPMEQVKWAVAGGRVLHAVVPQSEQVKTLIPVRVAGVVNSDLKCTSKCPVEPFQ
jgi:hypothetical protein